MPTCDAGRTVFVPVLPTGARSSHQDGIKIDIQRMQRPSPTNPGPCTPRTEGPKGAVHALFKAGVFLKGVDGVLEALGAVLLLTVTPGQISRIVSALTQHELSEDPHDFVATHLLHAARHLSMGTERFASVYLGSHAILKVLLVWALLRSKLWAYPIAIAVFLGFAAYQMYRYALSHSAAMLVLTVLDAFVIVLTWLEFRRVRAERRAATES